MELIPIEHFIGKFEVDLDILKDLCLEYIRPCFTGQELRSIIYHLRTLQIAMDEADELRKMTMEGKND